MDERFYTCNVIVLEKMVVEPLRNVCDQLVALVATKAYYP